MCSETEYSETSQLKCSHYQICARNSESNVPCFFFFKQKTAYEMSISDWSSDVCSSDLGDLAGERGAQPHGPAGVDAAGAAGPGRSHPPASRRSAARRLRCRRYPDGVRSALQGCRPERKGVV